MLFSLVLELKDVKNRRGPYGVCPKKLRRFVSTIKSEGFRCYAEDDHHSLGKHAHLLYSDIFKKSDEYQVLKKLKDIQGKREKKVEDEEKFLSYVEKKITFDLGSKDLEKSLTEIK